MPEHKFWKNIEINGLSYIFMPSNPVKGRIDFEWRLMVPEMVGMDLDENPDFFNGRMGEWNYWDRGGAAGYLKGFNCDFGFLLAQIHSNTPFLSPDLRHYKAPGLGNFLLKSLIEKADEAEKPIMLTPGPDKEGSIPPKAVIKWFQRNGFVYTSSYQMIRQPGGLITLIQRMNGPELPAGVPWRV